MGVRMKVPWDDGTVKLVAGEEYYGFSPSHAARLVRCGLADAIEGNKSVNGLRETMGLEPVDPLAEARRNYREAFGRAPYHGWDAEELNRRIAEQD